MLIILNLIELKIILIFNQIDNELEKLFKISRYSQKGY